MTFVLASFCEIFNILGWQISKKIKNKNQWWSCSCAMINILKRFTQM
jgi:hypothetical protein